MGTCLFFGRNVLDTQNLTEGHMDMCALFVELVDIYLGIKYRNTTRYRLLHLFVGFGGRHPSVELATGGVGDS